jgi:hypothetical protein
MRTREPVSHALKPQIYVKGLDRMGETVRGWIQRKRYCCEKMLTWWHAIAYIRDPKRSFNIGMPRDFLIQEQMLSCSFLSKVPLCKPPTCYVIRPARG